MTSEAGCQVDVKVYTNMQDTNTVVYCDIREECAAVQSTFA